MREYNTTSTSIFVIWDDVPSEDQNGIIRRYTVRYRSVRVEGPFNTTTVFTKEANLTGLIKDESYNVSVLATTVKGDGPYSVPKEFTTNEDGKYILLGNDHSMFFFLSTFVWGHRKSVSTAKKNASVNISKDAEFERDLLKSTQKPL